ncbi:hypothetical protein [Arthrobacter sp. ok909]|uniref:hypothetical protein n=1 Tax=Arthrobacter sp. ok909 TaxID=1761746 RepID=UPI000B84381C|nr:hypothetical protein [Arthrobacter sp. ok909]
MRLLQPRTRSGRFSTFGHAAPTVALPAARYPSELPFRRDRFVHAGPVQLLTRRHRTPVRDALEAAGGPRPLRNLGHRPGPLGLDHGPAGPTALSRAAALEN